MTDTGPKVIIVGGRPAGGSLAARLGQAGVSTLLLERATFPSYPAVSTPFLLAHAMELLDELGLDEAEYADGAPRIRHAMLEFHEYFRACIPLGERAGRAYCYTVDRSRLDTALWRSLDRYDSVTAIEGFTVTDLLHEGGRVVGVKGKNAGVDDVVEFRAPLVVGADGRTSRVGRAAGAEVVHRRTDLDTHAYYAFWEGVRPYDSSDEVVAQIHSSADGWSVVLMPMSGGRLSVMVQCQSALHDAEEGTPEEIYLRAIHARPRVAVRLADARMVTSLSGMKRIGNLFRTHGGPGWVLVGDAWHQKDSLDAQGIYDALFGARLLAEELIGWTAGQQDLESAIAAYGQRGTEYFRPMFDATMGRVQREVYSIPAAPIAKTVLRWLLGDAVYATRFSELLVRRRAPNRLLTPGLVLGALVRGAFGDLRRALLREPNPSQLPALSAPPPSAAD